MKIRNIIICAVIGIIAYIIIVDDDKQRKTFTSNTLIESEESAIDNEILNAVIKLCPDLDEQTISVVVNRFQRNAEAFAVRWGSQGIMLLNHLGAAGLEVGHEHAEAFSRCIPYMNPSTAGDFILAYAKIGKDLIKSGDLEFLLRRVNQLSKRQRNLALKYPQAWPFLLCDPDSVERALNIRPKTCMKTFFFHDLTEGPEGLKKTCEMIIESKDDGQMCAQVAGLDGLLIQNEFPYVFRGLSANGKDDLAIVIEILKNNIEGARRIVTRHGNDRLVDAVNSVVEADRQCRDPLAGFNQKRSYGHVYNAALYSPNALELIADHGKPGTKVLTNFGSIGCDIFYRYYAHDQKLVKPLLESLTQDYHQANLSCSIILEFAESGPYHNDFRRALKKAYSKRHEKDLYWLNIFPAISKEIDNPSEFFALFRKQQRRVLKDINGSYWTDSAKEAIPGHDTFVVLDVLFHGELPTTGQLIWAGTDVAFIVFDIVTAIPTGGTGLVAAESARAALKGTTKTALKQSSKFFKHAWKYNDKAIDKSIDFVRFGAKARAVEEVSTVLKTMPNKDLELMGKLLKKGWSPEMSFARLASKGHKPISIIKLTKSQKKFLKELTKNLIFDWGVGFVLLEGLQSDTTHSIIRKAVVLKEEAARISQIHLGQVAGWLKIKELKN